MVSTNKDQLVIVVAHNAFGVLWITLIIERVYVVFSRFVLHAPGGKLAQPLIFTGLFGLLAASQGTVRWTAAPGCCSGVSPLRCRQVWAAWTSRQGGSLGGILRVLWPTRTKSTPLYPQVSPYPWQFWQPYVRSHLASRSFWEFASSFLPAVQRSCYCSLQAPRRFPAYLSPSFSMPCSRWQRAHGLSRRLVPLG